MVESVKNSQWLQIYQNFLRDGINIKKYAPGGSGTGNDQAPPPPQMGPIQMPTGQEGGAAATSAPQGTGTAVPQQGGAISSGGGPSPLQVHTGAGAATSDRDLYQRFLNSTYGG